MTDNIMILDFIGTKEKEVKIDPELLLRVVDNLISNAKSYSKKGTTANTTSFGASKTVYHVKFDTGVGARVYTVVLSPYEGQYPTDMSQIDNLDPTYHYAFYTCQAIPGKLSTSNITFN